MDPEKSNQSENPAAADGNAPVSDAARREFIAKYGKYAAAAPLILGVLMTSGNASANSDTGPR